MSKNKQERKERNWQNFEITSIFLILVFITAIWKMYPGTLLELDEDNTPVTVASRPGAHEELPSDEQKSYFEKIGEKYGTYGDAYGSLNTLFSGWAFALLLISLFMQRQELQAQRKELAAQRDEISKSNDIAEQQRGITEQQAKLLEQQIKDTKIQNFNQVLFQFLDEKKLRLDSIKQDNVEAHKILRMYAMSFLDTLEIINLEDINEENKDDSIFQIKNLLDHAYLDINIKFDEPFERILYFDFIADLIIFIEENAEIENIKISINILKMYMTHDEILCFAWLAAINPDFTDLFIEYGLLSSFKGDDFPHAYNVLELIFSDKAFKTLK